MKKKILLSISLICLLIVVILAVHFVISSRTDGEKKVDNSTGMQGSEEDSSETDWEDGLQEEVEAEQETPNEKQEDPNNQNADAKKDESKKDENLKEQESDTQKKPDKQEDEEDVVVPQPNTETGWGPIL